MSQERKCNKCGETSIYSGKALKTKCRFCGEKNVYEAEETLNIDSSGAEIIKEKKTTTESFLTIDNKQTQTSDSNLEVFGDESIKLIVKTLFDAVAKRRGDFWKLSEEELKTLSKPTAKVLNKRVGPMIGEYGEEVSLVALYVMIIGGRTMQDFTINGDKKENQKLPEVKKDDEEQKPLSVWQPTEAELPKEKVAVTEELAYVNNLLKQDANVRT